MVRASMARLPEKEAKRGKKARRRYDVALSVPGAEMRLPSLPQVRVGWRIVSLALVMMLGMVLYTLWNSPIYKVSEAEVAGLKRLTTRDVNAVLGISGKPVFVLSSKRMQQELQQAFPELSQVEVKIDLPNTVQVAVTERQPVITWRQDGRTELVDEDGIAFPMRTGAGDAPAVVVEASSPPPLAEPLPDQASPAQLDTADLAAALQLPAGQAPDTLAEDGQPAASAATSPVAGTRRLLSPEMVQAILALAVRAPQNTPIVYDALHGLGWKDPRGWVVYFGDMRDVKMKLSVYQTILNRLKAKEIKPSLISVEFVHAPYYRVE